MTTVEALKALYVALGGSASDVADCVTNVDVLNVISAKYDGDSDAILNPEAIANITAVADNIGGTTPTGTKSITANGTHDVAEYASAEVNVASDFSVSEVTVIVPDGKFAEIFVSQAVNENNDFWSDSNISFNEEGTYTFDVILYKGHAKLYIDTDGTINVSGDISSWDGVSTSNYDVTGNATITLTTSNNS